MNRSVQPAWCRSLPIQQQSVLFLAARGPDGIPKAHPCKEVVRAYRATVLLAARYGRPMTLDDPGDSFMSLEVFRSDVRWPAVVKEFFLWADQLPHHYLMHLAHGAEIIGVWHPDALFRQRWWDFYVAVVEDLHLTPETPNAMNKRLNDWGQRDWVEMIPAPLPAQVIDPALEEARLEVERLTAELHGLLRHPDYEYDTTTNGRKDGMNRPPEGEGWEVNTEYHNGFERFDYHEENYWRRRRTAGVSSPDSIPAASVGMVPRHRG